MIPIRISVDPSKPAPGPLNGGQAHPNAPTGAPDLFGVRAARFAGSRGETARRSIYGLRQHDRPAHLQTVQPGHQPEREYDAKFERSHRAYTTFGLRAATLTHSV